jgi:hypothetical protein
MTYVLLTRAPLSGPKPLSFDLHVLGAPLTFVLSQDQTLQLNPEVHSIGSAFGQIPDLLSGCPLAGSVFGVQRPGPSDHALVRIEVSSTRDG